MPGLVIDSWGCHAVLLVAGFELLDAHCEEADLLCRQQSSSFAYVKKTEKKSNHCRGTEGELLPQAHCEGLSLTHQGFKCLRLGQTSSTHGTALITTVIRSL